MTNKRFEAGVMVIILLNMVAMALEYDKMPDTLADSLDCVNLIFVCVFTLECFMKLIALRLYYFKEPWNVFDFIIVVVSVICKTALLSHGARLVTGVSNSKRHDAKTNSPTAPAQLDHPRTHPTRSLGKLYHAAGSGAELRQQKGFGEFVAEKMLLIDGSDFHHFSAGKKQVFKL